MDSALLGPAEIREIAGRLGIRPSKRLGQNFVTDAGTVRRIVALAGLSPSDTVLEVGPGFGSLTFGLLGAARRVVAVELDPVLAAELPCTVASRAPALMTRLEVVTADAARVGDLPGEPLTALVANLPYNAAVPVVLHLLATVPSLRHGLIMVQAEVADRMTAPPGSRIYGVPSVKLAWFARPAGPGRCHGRCSGRCPTWTPGWSPSPGTTRPWAARPAPRCSRWWTPPSRNGARRFAPHWRPGRDHQRRRSGSCGKPAWTHGRAVSHSAWRSSPGSPRPTRRPVAGAGAVRNRAGR